MRRTRNEIISACPTSDDDRQVEIVITCCACELHFMHVHTAYFSSWKFVSLSGCDPNFYVRPKCDHSYGCGLHMQKRVYVRSTAEFLAYKCWSGDKKLKRLTVASRAVSVRPTAARLFEGLFFLFFGLCPVRLQDFISVNQRRAKCWRT